MRETKPSVTLVAEPQVNWEPIGQYLLEIGGSDWYVRKEDVRDNSMEEWNDGQDLIELGGRLCYRSFDVGLNANVTKIRTEESDYFENLLKSGHGSVLEHANYSFIFHNVSRVFTHEVVRHRVGTAFSQESMRFVRLTDIPFWFPDWFKDLHPSLYAEAQEVLTYLETFQRKLGRAFGLDDEGVPFTEKKHKTSFMRRFAPDGVSTSILVTMNIRAIRHLITMRTDESAEEEIRLVFDQVAHIMSYKCPLLFGDYERTVDGTWKTKYRKV